MANEKKRKILHLGLNVQKIDSLISELASEVRAFHQDRPEYEVRVEMRKIHVFGKQVDFPTMYLSYATDYEVKFAPVRSREDAVKLANQIREQAKKLPTRRQLKAAGISKA